jgi:hypothetical protein
MHEVVGIPSSPNEPLRRCTTRYFKLSLSFMAVLAVKKQDIPSAMFFTKSVYLRPALGPGPLLEAYTARERMVVPGEPSPSTPFRLFLPICRNKPRMKELGLTDSPAMCFASHLKQAAALARALTNPALPTHRRGALTCSSPLRHRLLKNPPNSNDKTHNDSDAFSVRYILWFARCLL